MHNFRVCNSSKLSITRVAYLSVEGEEYPSLFISCLTEHHGISSNQSSEHPTIMDEHSRMLTTLSREEASEYETVWSNAVFGGFDDNFCVKPVTKPTHMVYHAKADMFMNKQISTMQGLFVSTTAIKANKPILSIRGPQPFKKPSDVTYLFTVYHKREIMCYIDQKNKELSTCTRYINFPNKMIGEEPNVKLQQVGSHLFMVSTKDIAVGEELLCDYREEMCISVTLDIMCKCGNVYRTWAQTGICRKCREKTKVYMYPGNTELTPQHENKILLEKMVKLYRSCRPPFKRKRGRPRKHPTVASLAQVAPPKKRWKQTAYQHANLNAKILITAQKVKRKRGRPRKNPLGTSSLANITAGTSKNIKKKGRPRKNTEVIVLN